MSADIAAYGTSDLFVKRAVLEWNANRVPIVALRSEYTEGVVREIDVPGVITVAFLQDAVAIDIFGVGTVQPREVFATLLGAIDIVIVVLIIAVIRPVVAGRIFAVTVIPVGCGTVGAAGFLLLIGKKVKANIFDDLGDLIAALVFRIEVLVTVEVFTDFTQINVQAADFAANTQFDEARLRLVISTFGEGAHDTIPRPGLLPSEVGIGSKTQYKDVGPVFAALEVAVIDISNRDLIVRIVPNETGALEG